MEREKLKKAVTLLTEARSDLEALMGIQAKMLWSYYNKLKEKGFNDEQPFELTKRAAPKQMEVKRKNSSCARFGLNLYNTSSIKCKGFQIYSMQMPNRNTQPFRQIKYNKKRKL